jgi:hypothetical protein
LMVLEGEVEGLADSHRRRRVPENTH